MNVTITSNSPDTTHELGVRMGPLLSGHAVLLVEGELGSGKTLLTKGIYTGLGGPDEEQVLSPSYTLVHQYEDARMPIFHIDLYRLEKEGAIHGLDYEEFLYQNPGVTIIEWPRGAADLLEPEDFLHIQFRPGDSMTERTIELRAVGRRYQALIEELSR